MKHSAAWVVLAMLLGSVPLRAQVQPDPAAEQLQREQRIRELQDMELDTRIRANQAVPVTQRMLFDYGAYLSFNYLSLDDSQDDNHVLRETDFIPYLRLNIDSVQEVFLRGRIGWRDFNDGDSFDGRGDEAVDGDLDRGYYRLDLGRSRGAYGGRRSDTDFVFQGGRDLVYWANGLVLAEVIDGVIVDVSREPFGVQVVAGVTPVRTVDIDSSRPNFDHNTRRGFFGAMLSAQAGAHRPFIYGLIQRDYNEDDFNAGPIATKFDYNSYYIGVGSTGSLGNHLRYGVEAAYEFGNTLSNSFDFAGFGIVPVEQTRDDISAYALDARLDYLLNDPHQTRLGAEFIFASGDDDRGHTSNTFNGNSPGTTDRAFNAFGLLNTGLSFAPDVSNLVALRGGAATFPFSDSSRLRRLQIGTDFFIYGKADRDAPIDEQTGEERFLGVESDVYLNWELTSDVTLAIRYGVFFPNTENFAIDEPRQFLFAGLTWGF